MAAANPEKHIRLFFQDEARVGQKGRLCHRRWTKGKRPPGVADRRYDWTDIFAAVEPATGHSFALVLPTVSTRIMVRFLEEFARTLAPDEHAVIVLGGAGWHTIAQDRIPAAITLVHQPPCSPEGNPVERVWLFLRERFLSLQVWTYHQAIIQACCTA